jgi:hypothetical protein
MRESKLMFIFRCYLEQTDVQKNSVPRLFLGKRTVGFDFGIVSEIEKCIGEVKIGSERE